jgi:hypothetical protein
MTNPAWGISWQLTQESEATHEALIMVPAMDDLEPKNRRLERSAVCEAPLTFLRSLLDNAQQLVAEAPSGSPAVASLVTAAALEMVVCFSGRRSVQQKGSLAVFCLRAA